MSALVSPSSIEEIVGVRRHSQVHYGRAVSSEQTVYILHSQQCLDIGDDLRECHFSVALDRGIKLEDWDDLQDRPCALGVCQNRLVPIVDPKIADFAAVRQSERPAATPCVVQSGHFYRPTGSAETCVHCGDMPT